MSTPYYQDEAITLWHGDSLDILPTLDVTADVLLTDPPYFKVKDDEWDNQWDKAHEFLAWMGEFLDTTKPLLAPHASVWAFASPAMTSSVERLIAERFRVLNSIRWLKPSGTHNRVDVTQLRSFIPAWEGVIFAEQYDGSYADMDYESRKAVFQESGAYLTGQRTAAGLSRRQLGEYLVAAGVYSTVESATANISLQEIGSSKLSPRAHAAWSLHVPLKPFARFADEYMRLDAERLARREQYATMRRPFQIRHHSQSTDVWNFDRVKTLAGRHPCEKPTPMLRHMIEVSSRPGELILDPFAGSGSTLEAARETGRRCIGIEKDERYCEQAATRLSQGVLDFGEAS